MPDSAVTAIRDRILLLKLTNPEQGDGLEKQFEALISNLTEFVESPTISENTEEAPQFKFGFDVGFRLGRNAVIATLKEILK